MQTLVNDQDFNYVLYKPETKPGEELPLIIFLHGAGERGTDLELVKVNGLPKIFDGDVDYPCICISPQCPENTFWAAEVQKLKQFIDRMKEQYQAKYVCLTGISMGGFGTWFLAMAYPEMFKCIAPVCGGGMSWNAYVLNMPVWAFHGELDTVVPPFYTKDMMEKLAEHNPNTRMTIYPDYEHNSWEPAYNDELIQWLISGGQFQD